MSALEPWCVVRAVDDLFLASQHINLVEFT